MPTDDIWPARSNMETAWVTLSKKNSSCGECGAAISKGDALIYRRRPRLVACGRCGVELGLDLVPSRAFAASRAT